MTGRVQTQIRELLRDSDGMTVVHIRKALGLRVKDGSASVAAALRSMPDTYIDRWVVAEKGGWASVWCVVVPPEDCPKPD
jgi:hypothetical protein